METHSWLFAQKSATIVARATQSRNRNGPHFCEPFRELGYKDSNLDRRNQNPQSCHWTIPQSR